MASDHGPAHRQALVRIEGVVPVVYEDVEFDPFDGLDPFPFPNGEFDASTPMGGGLILCVHEDMDGPEAAATKRAFARVASEWHGGCSFPAMNSWKGRCFHSLDASHPIISPTTMLRIAKGEKVSRCSPTVSHT